MATKPTQFSELQKLLINVAENKCDAFINAHINKNWPTQESEANPIPSTLPEFDVEAGENDVYYNKVVFLKKYNTIYTKGTFFGNTWDLQNSISANGITVKYDPTQNKIVTTVDAAKYSDGAWSGTMTNVVDAQSVKDYVDDFVKTAVDAAAVTAMEYKGGLTQAGFDAFANAEDKQLLDGNVWVAEEVITISATVKAEKGDTIIVHYDESLENKLDYVVIERNVDNTVTASGNFTQNQILVAADNKQTAQTTGYFLGSDVTEYTAFGTANTLATEAGTAAYVVGKLGELNAEVTYNANVNNYVSYAYNQTDGLITYVNIDLKVAEYTYTAGSEGTLSTFTYNNDADSYGLIDHEILNNYMSYVSDAIGALDMDHSVTTLTEVDNDYLKVEENSGADDDNDYNYAISLNVVNLSDVVGMTYDETTGTWVAPEGSSLKNGLANAADVANELISDEKVIAAALNDHEARIDTLEDFVGDINGTIQDQLVIGDVTVNGLQVEETTYGLVNTTLLVSVINALDPWGEYTGE